MLLSNGCQSLIDSSRNFIDGLIYSGVDLVITWHIIISVCGIGMVQYKSENKYFKIIRNIHQIEDGGHLGIQDGGHMT